MIIEYMDAGSLTDFIYFYFKNIKEEVIAYICKEILKFSSINNFNISNLIFF